MFIILDRNSEVPLKKQVYDAIIGDIVNGKLKNGEKMPSTRMLSDSLNLARNILVEIYEQLIAEGYLEVVKGKGTFVSSLEIKPLRHRDSIKEVYQPAKKSGVIPFECGIPDLNSFPRNVWAGYLKAGLLEMTSRECGYSSILGYKPLRIEIADYLQKYKGINCSSSQIFITAGTSDAVGFLSMLLRNHYDNFLYEGVTVPFIPDIFKLQSFRMKAVSVDGEGILPAGLEEKSGSVLCVSPSHQFPLGGTLSFERRKMICDWLTRNHNILIEDDYDSEFRYKGASVNSIYQLAPDHVIHLGTFSKTLMPSLRLGYMVLPEGLLKEAGELRILLRKSTDMLNQIALYKLMESGRYVKHILKMKKIYKGKMLYLTRRLRELFGEEISINGENSGLHVAVTFHKHHFDRLFEEILLQNGLSIDLLTDYQQNPWQETNTLIFGFGNLEIKEIETGLKRLWELLNKDMK